MWDEDEFPELAANEYFCLTAVNELGLTVPHFELSDDGGAIVIERFDRIDEGYLGFDDFCVLNGLGTADKYKGGYETRLFKRIREFLEPADAPQALETVFKLFALNCAIRNGDAHLKNFGLTYPGIDATLCLAPVYDLVATWAYIPKDPMALTLGGSTKWPNRKQLVQLAQPRCQQLEAAADALSTTSPELKQYFKG